ncbi:E3.1.11.2 [Mytilus coruscus]|uniref:exodeoxyribonuclease III n=1 Tax=Mytilus coruscus TaxID=42192 RepID=A0A6J8DK82_MYTCO|nr:E3.1.11.2 [Mytilus coruscus]
MFDKADNSGVHISIEGAQNINRKLSDFFLSPKPCVQELHTSTDPKRKRSNGTATPTSADRMSKRYPSLLYENNSKKSLRVTKCYIRSKHKSLLYINKMSLKIASINVNGLRNNKKRALVFNWIVSQNIDLVCLQETHCTHDETGLWNREWKENGGGESFWNCGTNDSRGVGIL